MKPATSDGCAGVGPPLPHLEAVAEAQAQRRLGRQRQSIGWIRERMEYQGGGGGETHPRHSHTLEYFPRKIVIWIVPQPRQHVENRSKREQIWRGRYCSRINLS